MQSYHIRITSIDRIHALKIVNDFITKFMAKLIKYVFSHEISGSGQSHIHGHIQYKSDEVIPRSTLCDFFKALGLQGKYYHKIVQKEDELNILYVIKELDILTHNFSEEEFQTFLELTNTINENKKKNLKEKLIDHFLDKPYINLNDIASEITRLYIDDWNEFPPVHNTRKMTLYVAKKLGLCSKQYNDVVESIF